MLALLLPATASAHDFEVDGIYYNIIKNVDDNEVMVTYKGNIDPYAMGYNESQYSGEITIPDSVSFNGTTYLVTRIGYCSFYRCTSLTNVNIGNSVTAISDWAFSGCTSLANITIPNSVFDIGYNSFEGTAWYNNQPNGVVYAGLVAYTCKGGIPNSITLKEGTKGIATFAFGERDGLTSIAIPRSVIYIGESAFFNCQDLTSVYISDIEAWCKIRFGENPLRFAHHLFLNGEEVINLVIPNTVTSISGFAFEGCYGLTSVDIPNSVTSIGNSSFSECTNLTGIEIPNSVTSISDGAFSRCSGLTSIEIPNSVRSINDYTFYMCSSLTSVNIPNSVTSIGDYAFYDCSSLTNVNISDSITFIGENAFEGSTPWPNNLPDGVVYIGLIAYKYSGTMPAGTSISLREGTASIAASAFQGCSGLVSITIPNSLTSIGNYAFQNCSGLTSIDIPNSVTYIGESALSGCSGLTNVNIGNSVTSIGSYAFQNCSGLVSINIPNSVTYIVESALSGC